MVNVIKYSKERLKQYFTRFEKIYILFYDLDVAHFDNVICQLNLFLNIIKTNKIKIFNSEDLMISCSINHQKINSLVDLLDALDISEFEILEYDEEKEKKNLIGENFIKKENKNKSIYINKDENIIQLYNLRDQKNQ